MPNMFAANGQKHFLGGDFYTVKQGATFTFEGDGGGTDFHIGGSTRRTVVTDAFNDNSRTIGGGPGAPYHRGADPTAAFIGRRGRRVYPGIGRGSGSITVYDDVEGADIRNAGNNFSQRIGTSPLAPGAPDKGKAKAPSHEAGDEDDGDEDDDDYEDEDVLHNQPSSGHGQYATVHHGHGGTNTFFQHATNITQHGKWTGGSSFQSSSYSTASWSATDVVVSDNPELAENLRKMAKLVRDPTYQEGIMAATGGPTFTDIEPGAVFHKVERGRKKVIIGRDNIENSYYNNVGNDNSYSNYA